MHGWRQRINLGSTVHGLHGSTGTLLALHNPHIIINLFQYHLSCRGMLEQPEGDWFCDAVCRQNATGFAPRRKRRAGAMAAQKRLRVDD